jgi:hypothetical protein
LGFLLMDIPSTVWMPYDPHPTIQAGAASLSTVAPRTIRGSRMVSVGLVKASLIAIGSLMLVGCIGSGGEGDPGLSEYYDGLEQRAEQNAEDAIEAELEWADRQNAWADTHLGAEKTDALYWREALVKGTL